MPTANFGLRSRSGGGHTRPNSNDNPWTQARNQRDGNTVGNPDVQDIRSQISTKFHWYCEFTLGYEEKKPPPAKP